ncbi:tetratricopeptide repeat protein [bacterium]|nr:MAG: tetratricopeptide repeat protein [bacterium]
MRPLPAIVLIAVLASTAGCASSIQQWVVQTRIAQGQRSLADGNLADAAREYQLALRLAPDDKTVREGLALVQTSLAQKYFEESQLTEALDALDTALKADPQSVRVQELRQKIEQASIQKQIIATNFPTYAQAGAQIAQSYRALDLLNKRVQKELHTFRYDYDTAHLDSAIRDSYALIAEANRGTNRLLAYRQVVEAGLPESSGTVAPATGGSLLPLP